MLITVFATLVGIALGIVWGLKINNYMHGNNGNHDNNSK